MKRFFHLITITSLFAISLILLSTSNSFAAKLGDVDCDGKITSADSRLILRKSVQFSDTQSIPDALADIDMDGEVTPEDSRMALKVSTLDKKALNKYNVNSSKFDYNTKAKSSVLSKAQSYNKQKLSPGYDWCMYFVGLCFKKVNYSPIGFNRDITSCSDQIGYICKNNPKSLTFIIPRSTIESPNYHGLNIFNTEKFTKYKLSSSKIYANFNIKYTPSNGDVIFIDNKDSDDKDEYIACHTGFVYSVTKSNGNRYINTIEGNVNSSSYTYSEVAYKKYIVTNDGTFLVDNYGNINYGRQILAYYNPTF